jgi:ADP-ribose pyrophosphatase YjhB (NUDIX family)
VSDPRLYPERPFLAVSAGIVEAGRVLLIERARPPAKGLFTFPGGMVEAGETLVEAVRREMLEETGLVVDVIGLAGYREALVKDAQGRAERHAVILPFAARRLGGTLSLDTSEIGRHLWAAPDDLAGLPVTEGLAEIIARCLDLAASHPARESR